MKKVLIVEDNVLSAMFLEELINHRRFKVHVCLNPKEAINTIIDVEPDIVLLDIVMPHISGYDILHSVHRQRPNIRIIVISSLPAIYARERSIELGAQYFLEKPLDFGYTRQIIEDELAYIN